MLKAEQKEIITRKVLPLFEGWTINDIFDALEYAKGYVSDFATAKLPPFQSGQESNDK